jgi:hypothetical protein
MEGAESGVQRVEWRGLNYFADQWVLAALGCRNGPMIDAPRLSTEEGAARNLVSSQRVSIPNSGTGTGHTGHCHPPSRGQPANWSPGRDVGKPRTSPRRVSDTPQRCDGTLERLLSHHHPKFLVLPPRQRRLDARPPRPKTAPIPGHPRRVRLRGEAREEAGCNEQRATSNQHPEFRLGMGNSFTMTRPLPRLSRHTHRRQAHHAHPHQTMTPGPASASDRSGCIHRSSRCCRPTPRKWAACSLFGSLAAPHAS